MRLCYDGEQILPPLNIKIHSATQPGQAWSKARPNCTDISWDGNRDGSLNDSYQQHLRSLVGAERTFFAGRLANYVYIDMDDCMRQALDAAEDVLNAVGASA